MDWSTAWRVTQGSKEKAESWPSDSDKACESAGFLGCVIAFRELGDARSNVKDVFKSSDRNGSAVSCSF